jgi:hypothetical protein
MMHKAVMYFGAALALAGALAQAAPTSPYAGGEGRDIKALAPEEVEALLEGAGAGFARAAELNRYPGPVHVLELADALALTPEQRARTQTLYREMRAAARALGAELIAAERALDRLFARGEVTPERLDEALARIGAARTALRGVHLRAHLDQRALLTEAQVHAYHRLRGYAGEGAHSHGDGRQPRH